MSEKVTVSHCAIAGYFLFVVCGCLLSGLLPPFINRPTCAADEPVLFYSADIQNEPSGQQARLKRSLVTPGVNDEYQTRFIAPDANRAHPICSELASVEHFTNRAYPWEAARLPKAIVPTHYEVDFIIPQFAEPDVYDGLVVINANVIEATNTFILHAKYLKLWYEELTDSTGKSIDIECVGTFAANDYIVMRTKSMMQPGSIKFSANFQGYLNMTNSGLFEFKFVTEELEERSMVASKFEPLDARKAFPCFDEPNMKATFSLSIVHPNDTSVLSNSPVLTDVSIPTADGFQLTKFDITPKLPTHSLALVLFSTDDFTHIQKVTSQGMNISIYAQSKRTHYGYVDRPMDMALKIMNALEDIFSDVPEARPKKIDIFAIPTYEVDAVSHYGLPIFSENKIIFRDETVSERNKQTIALEMARVLAQHWFGNYVTFEWWDDLWLQEALADFFKYKAVDQAYNEWLIKDQFITEEMIKIQVEDGFSTTHPIEKDSIANTGEIRELFDQVETAKANAVLRMVESELSGDSFMTAVVAYLKQNANGNGNLAAFTKNLGNVRKWSAADFMDRWLRQSNFPVINVKLATNSQGKSVVKFIQSRAQNAEFSVFSDTPYPSPYDYVWFVPVRCTFGQSASDDATVTDEFDLDTRELEQVIGDGTKTFKWVHCNRNFDGYYLSDYSLQNWENLGSALKAKNPIFEPIDRAQIIHNVFLNAYSQRTNYQQVVDLLLYIDLERDYLPWRTVHKHLTDMSSILEFRAAFYPVSKYFENQMHDLDVSMDLWNDTGSHTQMLTKETILELSCRLQHNACLKKTTEMWETVYNATLGGIDQNYELYIPAYVRAIVYNYHFQNTYDVKEWDYIFYEYKFTLDLQERDRLQNALTYSRLPWLLSDFLTSLKTNGLKEIDFFEAMADLGRNPLGREIAWDYMRMNYPALEKQFGEDDPRLGQMLIDVTSTFENEFLYEELLRHIAFTSSGSGQFARLKVIETVSTNLVWLLDNEREIEHAFSGERLNHAIAEKQFYNSMAMKEKLTQIYKKYQ